MFTDTDRSLIEQRVLHRSELEISKDQLWYRVKKGLWTQVFPNVFAPAAATLDPTLLRQAALLWAGHDAALSHRSAGTVFGLDAVVEVGPELAVPAKRNPRTKGVIVHRLDIDDDIVVYAGVRCTGVVRTLLDLATVLDEDALEAAIDSARRLHGTSLAALNARDPAGRLRRVLQRFDSTPAESLLEVKVARLVRTAKLPPPVTQLWVTIFGRRYRLDFAWPEQRLALECDGRAFHEFERDRQRLRDLAAAGWTVLPVTWRDVHERWNEIEAQLRVTLAR